MVNAPRPIATTDEVSTWGLSGFNDEEVVKRKKTSEILEAFKTNSSVILRALKGLGGVGKTTIAKMIIHSKEIQDMYPFRAWFNAESKDTIIKGYRKLVVRAGIYSLEEAQKQNKDIIKNAVFNWLEKTSGRGCFIVYDNAENYDDLKPYLPNKGHFLITTRSGKWRSNNIIDIGVMEPDEALTLFRNIVQTNVSGEEINELIDKRLGRLPLAIAQAAAFIKTKGMTLKRYIEIYDNTSNKLWAHPVFPDGDLDDKHAKKIRTQDGKYIPKTVAITWLINFEQIKEAGAHALHVQNACAFLGAANISEAILRKSYEERFSEENTDLSEDPMKILIDYSLISENKDPSLTLSMHRLVQDVIKDYLSTKDRSEMLTVLKSLIAAIEAEKNPVQFVIFVAQILIGMLGFMKKKEEITGDVFNPFDHSKINGFSLSTQLLQTLEKAQFDHLDIADKERLAPVFKELYDRLLEHDLLNEILYHLELKPAEKDGIMLFLSLCGITDTKIITKDLGELLLSRAGLKKRREFDGLSKFIMVFNQFSSLKNLSVMAPCINAMSSLISKVEKSIIKDQKTLEIELNGSSNNNLDNSLKNVQSEILPESISSSSEVNVINHANSSKGEGAFMENAMREKENICSPNKLASHP